MHEDNDATDATDSAHDSRQNDGRKESSNTLQWSELQHSKPRSPVTKSSSLPNATAVLPTTAPPRRSMQHSASETVTSRMEADSHAGTARKHSRDFDVRKDGPFGRPSLTMSRHVSSSGSIRRHVPSDDGPEPPTIGESEAEVRAPDPVLAGLDSLQSTDAAFEPEPPPLDYSLWDRRWSITFWWTMIVFDSVVMPIGLYFGLWYGTSRSTLSANTVFSIVTAALGGASILDYFLRLWRLWKKTSTCRVIGAKRIYLDWFHWNFTLAWLIIMIELIV